MSEHDEPKTALTRLLGQHLWHHTRTTHCSCGFRTPLAQLAVKGYLAHLADVILAEGYTTTPAPEAVETVEQFDRPLVRRARRDPTWVPVDRGADGHEEGER